MSWFNIFKAFTQEQVLNAWIELRQYLEITCGIYDIDYGEPENLYSIAGRMQELKEIILGEEGDIGKQFSKIEDYTDDVVPGSPEEVVWDGTVGGGNIW